jgi:hypothetical protein
MREKVIGWIPWNAMVSVFALAGYGWAAYRWQDAASVFGWDHGLFRDDWQVEAVEILTVAMILLPPWIAALTVPGRALPARTRVLLPTAYTLVMVGILWPQLASSWQFFEEVRQVHRGHQPARLAMRVPPAVAVDRALSRGDSSFLATMGYSLVIPEVENLCTIDRYGARVVDGTGDSLIGIDDGRFQGEAFHYAVAYNRILTVRLHLRRDELEAPASQNVKAAERCPGGIHDRPRSRFPAGYEIPR